MASARADFRALTLDKVLPKVHHEFCRVMDVLSDRDWTRFASEVASDITEVRLAEKKQNRTDSLMLYWQTRNGTVGQLLDLLQRLELLRPWDIINNCEAYHTALAPLMLLLLLIILLPLILAPSIFSTAPVCSSGG